MISNRRDGVKRSDQQRNSIELYCRKLAEALNDAGFSVNDNVVIKLPVSWTQGNVKELMFKAIMTALYPEISSTTELETDQVSAVYEELNRAVAERTGVHVPFPSKDELMNESLNRMRKK